MHPLLASLSHMHKRLHQFVATCSANLYTCYSQTARVCAGFKWASCRHHHTLTYVHMRFYFSAHLFASLKRFRRIWREDKYLFPSASPSQLALASSPGFKEAQPIAKNSKLRFSCKSGRFRNHNKLYSQTSDILTLPQQMQHVNANSPSSDKPRAILFSKTRKLHQAPANPASCMDRTSVPTWQLWLTVLTIRQGI